MKLRKCYCGSSETHVMTMPGLCDAYDGGVGHYVHCQNCGAAGKIADTPELAQQLWDEEFWREGSAKVAELKRCFEQIDDAKFDRLIGLLGHLQEVLNEQAINTASGV